MEKRHRCSIDAAEAPEKGTGVEPQRTTTEDKQFKLTGETLYGGKGKHSSLTITIVIVNHVFVTIRRITRGGNQQTMHRW
jgi:hypothetical protein